MNRVDRLRTRWLGRSLARVLRVVALAVVGSLALSGCRSSESPPPLTLAHAAPPGSPIANAAAEYARRVNARTDLDLQLVVDESRGERSEAALLDELRRGSLDLALITDGLSSEIPAFGLFDLPYLTGGASVLDAWADALLRDPLASEARATGLEVLAIWEGGYRHLASTGGGIDGPNDLKGLRVAVPRNVWRVALAEVWEAVPTSSPDPLNAGTGFDAFEIGLVELLDHVDLGPATPGDAAPSRVALSAHVQQPIFVVTGAASARDRSPEVQAALSELAQAMRPWAITRSGAIEDEALARIRMSGIVVDHPDREALRAAAQPLYERFARTVPEGGRLLARVNGMRLR